MVKSHLMFAVREEVEVLKEQIRDLAERNAALEQENGLLRALASPEQLAQLPSSAQTGKSWVLTQEPIQAHRATGSFPKGPDSPATLVHPWLEMDVFAIFA